MNHVFQRYAQTTPPSLFNLFLTFASAIREYDAKLLLAYWLERATPVAPNAGVKTNFKYPSVKVAQISWDPETNSITPDSRLPGWVYNTKLVAKPDQLIKRRGKAGLLALNKTWDEAKEWIAQRAGKPQKVGTFSHLPFFLLHSWRIYAFRWSINAYPLHHLLSRFQSVVQLRITSRQPRADEP